MAKKQLGLGIMGFGGFGMFAVQQFLHSPVVKPVGMASTHREAAVAAAERYGLPAPMDVQELLRQPDVDMVYIATPPFLHYPQAKQALEHGKHVLCEKPLALTIEQADELVALARQKDLLLAVNLIQRYNPLFDAIRTIVVQKPLGEFLHGYFENWASDEGLTADHWFWDREKSGGIFIEHGVHFFDLFAGWFGRGEVVAAQQVLRPGTDIQEQVQCTVRYPGDRLVQFYHGFHQAGRLDRQEMRLLFERGDILLEEWVPTRIRIHGVVGEHDMRLLHELFPRAVIDVEATYGGAGRTGSARHKPYDVYQMCTIRAGGDEQKMHVYSALVRALMQDQTAWIFDRNHQRKITEENGRDSLAAGVRATELIAQSC